MKILGLLCHSLSKLKNVSSLVEIWAAEASSYSWEIDCSFHDITEKIWEMLDYVALLAKVFTNRRRPES